MTPFPILDDLGLVLAGGATALAVSRPLRIPPLLAYMLAGLLLGPVTGLLRVSASLDLFAELGVALLLFVVGLELSVDKIRAFGVTALVAGSVQVGVTFGLAAGLASLLGFDTGGAVVAGLAAAFSSTAVVVKLLDRAGEMESRHGRLALGILLVQDILVVIILTALGGVGAHGEPTGADLAAGIGASDAGGWWAPMVAMTGVILGGAALGRWLLPPLVRWLSPSGEGLFIVGLTWAFGFLLAAEGLHLSVELGAFIAGVILAQLPHIDHLRRTTHPLVDFFLAVFFVSLGARIETASMATTWPAALAMSAFVLAAKPVIITGILSFLGQSPTAAVLTGLTLGQVSEFAFILAGLATANGLVSSDFFGFVGMVGLVTIGASAILVPRGPAIVGALDRAGLLGRLPAGGATEAEPEPPLEGHVVVVGMNTLGRRVVERLTALGESVLAIDTDAGKLQGLPARVLVGDITQLSLFQEAAVEQAALVVSALQIEDVNSLVAYRCRRLGVPVSVHAFDPSLVEELLELGADHLMVSKHDGIRAVEEGLRELGVFG